jgi:hypothetical protein
MALITTVLVLSCSGSNRQVFTGPPPRTTPLDSVKAGVEPYKLGDLPDSLSFSFTVPGDTACPVVVELHDSGTRLLRTLIDSVYSPGTYGLTWDKKDSTGNFIREQRFYYYQFIICGDSSTLKFDYRRQWE